MTVLDLLAIIYGLAVGVSLGLSGGGGSIFAVPLLVYGLRVPVTTALGLSLATVGLTAGLGAAMRLRNGEVEWRAAAIFAAAGMLTAPLGTLVGHQIPSALLLSAFAFLMLYVGLLMWRGRGAENVAPGPCVRLAQGRLLRGCVIRLSAAGIASGILSGLFGVGGGFIIVPALLYVTGMSIHRAVPTSLMVIALISISGVASHLVHGQTFPMPLTPLFLLGGLAGMLAGNGLRSRFGGPMLQRLFGAGMWAAAAYMLARNLPHFL